jgi:hypothetical protein
MGDAKRKAIQNKAQAAVDREPLEQEGQSLEPAADHAAEPEAAPQRQERSPEPSEQPFVKADPSKNPRHQAIKEIAERTNANLAAEAAERFNEVDEEGNPIEAAPSLEEAARAANAAAGQIEEEAPAAAATPATPPKGMPVIDPSAEYDFVVDGKPVKILGSKIIRDAQINTAADQRLSLASQLLEEAKAKSGALPAGAQPPLTPAGTKAPTDEELAEMIQFGTKEQAAAALATLRTSSRAVTPEQIAGFVSQQVSRQIETSRQLQRAAEFMQTEYPDIMGNRYLRNLFDMEEDTRRKAGVTLGYVELYKLIGDDIRKGLGLQAPTKQNQQPLTMEQRREDKEKIQTPPKTAAVRLAEQQGGEKKELKLSDRIAAINARRGQQSLNQYRRSS